MLMSVMVVSKLVGRLEGIYILSEHVEAEECDCVPLTNVGVFVSYCSVDPTAIFRKPTPLVVCSITLSYSAAAFVRGIVHRVFVQSLGI
jgi:hypothetical protein